MLRFQQVLKDADPFCRIQGEIQRYNTSDALKASRSVSVLD
jgi:hypothetical protein